MKKTINYLATLPSRAINNKLDIVEAIALSVLLMIIMTIGLYMINPQIFAE